MDDTLAGLVRAAGAAAAQGRWNEAEQLWKRVQALDPQHPQALYSLGIHAWQRGDANAALDSLQAAHAVAPRDPAILVAIAVVLRAQADAVGEGAAIDAALVAEPSFLPALLAKGDLLERQGRARLAADVFRNALRVAPPEARWPSSLRSQLAHATQQVARNGSELAQFLAARLQSPLQALDGDDADRWREAASIASGLSRPYVAQCNQLYVPRLPAIPFFDRALFPWAAGLEAQTDAIRDELRAALQQDGADFRPYVAYAPGQPVNQWQELNHSTRWSHYALWRDGAPQEEHLARCPRTAQALQSVGMADIGGLCPNAMFSALAPRTRIPPHHGETNARIVVHLPLIVPAGCRYRVGFEHREWRVGEILAFDDSLEHEAVNDSDELRVVLIFDVWNPLLSEAERDVVRALSAATREFLAG